MKNILLIILILLSGSVFADWKSDMNEQAEQCLDEQRSCGAMPDICQEIAFDCLDAVSALESKAYDIQDKYKNQPPASRCDCSPSKRGGSCNATIQYVKQSSGISITSDADFCSMVTWHANGNPKVTTVVDRINYEKWLGKGIPSLEINSCDVCTDRQVAEINNVLGITDPNDNNASNGTNDCSTMRADIQAAEKARKQMVASQRAITETRYMNGSDDAIMAGSSSAGVKKEYKNYKNVQRKMQTAYDDKCM